MKSGSGLQRSGSLRRRGTPAVSVGSPPPFFPLHVGTFAEDARLTLSLRPGGGMPKADIPSDIFNFIHAHIDSIAVIEALLLLRRSTGEWWQESDVANRLYILEKEAGVILAQLCADGLLECDGARYRYRPLPPLQEDLVARLGQAYQSQLVAITQIIHARPGRIREFANAFKFRKDQG